MLRRLHVLLVALGVSTCLTGAYWLWPDLGRPLPYSAVAKVPKPLYVVRVQPVTEAAVKALVESLAPHLPIAVQATDEWELDERATLEWEEDLYDSQKLVALLEEITPPGTRVLGITDQPMYDEGHWWLFGTGQLGGRTAVVSTAHLWVDDIVGNTAHPRFRDRLSKVAVHEFGHTMGFMHCPHIGCVMLFSPDLEVLDNSRHTFCHKCLMREF